MLTSNVYFIGCTLLLIENMSGAVDSGQNTCLEKRVHREMGFSLNSPLGKPLKLPFNLSFIS